MAPRSRNVLHRSNNAPTVEHLIYIQHAYIMPVPLLYCDYCMQIKRLGESAKLPLFFEKKTMTIVFFLEKNDGHCFFSEKTMLTWQILRAA